MRFLITLLIWLGLFMVETSFFTSLPGIFAFTPLVFATSVYLYQHQQFRPALVYLVLYGVLLDLFHLSNVPSETVALLCAALVMLFASHRLFSHRSLYGMVGLATIVYTSWVFMQALMLLWKWLLSPEMVMWQQFLATTTWRFAMLLVVTSILFSFGGRIRQFMSRSFLLSR